MIEQILPQIPENHRSWLQDIIEQLIPISSCTGFKIMELSECHLILKLPLEPNKNDKSTLFGGVSSMILSLAGWALISYRLKLRAKDLEIVIAKQKTAYKEPMRTTFATVRVELSDEIFNQFWQKIILRNKSSISLKAIILDANHNVCVDQESIYVGYK